MYYAREINAVILVGLNFISTMQSEPTQESSRKVNYLLNYLATHPKFTVKYKALDLILQVDSDVSCLVKPDIKYRT